ncbi:MAG: hypothetical protein ACREM3_01935 [Candidatus Rokuibacteriota bacterium]
MSESVARRSPRLADHPIRPIVMRMTSRRPSAVGPRHGFWSVIFAVVSSLACAAMLQLVLGAG